MTQPWYVVIKTPKKGDPKPLKPKPQVCLIAGAVLHVAVPRLDSTVKPSAAGFRV